MQKSELILKHMKCCLDNDDHIVQDAIMLRCGGNACKSCISNSNKQMIKCFYCNQCHKKTDLIKMPSNHIFQNLIEKKYFKSLADDLKSDLLTIMNQLIG